MSKKNQKFTADTFSNNPFASQEVECLAVDNENPEMKEAAKPRKGLCRIRLEKKGRAGKKVTVLYGFEPVLELTEMMDLLSQLKKKAGVGGTVREDTLEIQGDTRQRTADILRENNYKVKGEI
jgi:translation initiation factor 1